MYAMAASPLAKQTETRGGAGEMNTEHMQKQQSLWIRTVFEQGSVITRETPSRRENQGANNNPKFKCGNNHNLNIFSKKHGRKKSMARWGVLQAEMIIFYCCGV